MVEPGNQTAYPAECAGRLKCKASLIPGRVCRCSMGRRVRMGHCARKVRHAMPALGCLEWSWRETIVVTSMLAAAAAVLAVVVVDDDDGEYIVVESVVAVEASAGPRHSQLREIWQCAMTRVTDWEMIEVPHGKAGQTGEAPRVERPKTC